ncbi:guanylate-binding protein 1 isoform X1 [Tachysurus ichikawai]
MFNAMDAPVCLICSDSNGQLCVAKEAKKILDEITQPVVVVSVVGLYRTGKSYLMNRLAGLQTVLLRVFPSFIWSVRDFMLKLEKDGRVITADEYLESALDLQPGISPKVEKFNLNAICVTFLQNGGVLYFHGQPKMMIWQGWRSYLKQILVQGGRILIGSALACLAEVYVGAIRNGEVPCLENAVVTLAQIRNERAVEQALQVYQSWVSEKVCFPLAPSELSDIHRNAETAAIDIISTSFNDTEQKAQLKLMEEIQTLYQELCGQNQQECLNVYKVTLTEIFSPLDEDINYGTFMHPGGYKAYRDKLQSLTNEYKAHTHKQLMSEEVLSEYLKEKNQFGKTILLSDLCFTEAERIKEVEHLQKELLEQKNKSLEEMKEIQEQVFKDQQMTYEQNVTQLLERMKQERERAKADNEQVLEAKLKEQKALLEERFKDRADLMNREIESLKGEMKTEDESKRSTLSKVVDTLGTAATLFLPGIIPKVAGIAASHVLKYL